MKGSVMGMVLDRSVRHCLTFIIAVATMLPILSSHGRAMDAGDYIFRGAIPTAEIALQIAEKIENVRSSRPDEFKFTVDGFVAVKYYWEGGRESITLTNTKNDYGYSVGHDGIDDFLNTCRDYARRFGSAPLDRVPPWVKEHEFWVPGIKAQLPSGAILNNPQRRFELVNVDQITDVNDFSNVALQIFYFSDQNDDRIAIFWTAQGFLEVPSGKHDDPYWQMPFIHPEPYHGPWIFACGDDRLITIYDHNGRDRLFYKEDPNYKSNAKAAKEEQDLQEKKRQEWDNAPLNATEVQLRELGERHGLVMPPKDFRLKDSYELQDGAWAHDFFNFSGKRRSTVFETAEGIYFGAWERGDERSGRWQVGDPMKRVPLPDFFSKWRGTTIIKRNYTDGSHHVDFDIYERNGVFYYPNSSTERDPEHGVRVVARSVDEKTISGTGATAATEAARQARQAEAVEAQKKLESASLFADSFGAGAESGGIAEAASRILKGFPENCIRAEMTGKPQYCDGEVELEITVVLDGDAVLAFTAELADALEASGYSAEMLSASLTLNQAYDSYIDIKFQPPGRRNFKDTVMLCTQVNDALTSSSWKHYKLPRESIDAILADMSLPEIIVALVDASGSSIVSHTQEVSRPFAVTEARSLVFMPVLDDGTTGSNPAVMLPGVNRQKLKLNFSLRNDDAVRATGVNVTVRSGKKLPETMWYSFLRK